MDSIWLLGALITGAGAGAGPDAIVADIPNVRFWARDEVESAYSTAVRSCNIGDEDLSWAWPPSAEYPPRGTNLFRLSSDGRFEQIGQSWVFSVLCALQQNDGGCGTCGGGGGCLDVLRPGCSTPNAATYNGNQAILQPKWQINPHTGAFVVPWHEGEGIGGPLGRRLRVANDDLDPARHPGARFIFERQIVGRDDAAAGNQNNGATYREARYDPNTFGFAMVGAAQPQRPAIAAWRDAVPGVTLVDVQVEGDGLFIVGCAVTPAGDGAWSYEYAIQNLNAHRAGRAFTVPVPDDVQVTAIGFHDVDYHSGDGIGGVDFDGTDWTASRGGGALTWSTGRIEENENANALRWGTLYNFRFTANTPPRSAPGRLELFRAGDPPFVAVAIDAPRSARCPADVNDSGAVDFDDLLAVLAAWGACEECPEDLDGSGTVDFADLLAVLANWGACE